MNLKFSRSTSGSSRWEFLTVLVLLFVVLSLLMGEVYLPGKTLFSNDGPLGRLMEQCHQLPSRFLGCWADLNYLGANAGGAPPTISFGLCYLLGPVAFSKFYAPTSLLILGLGAWTFFRQMGFCPQARILGALAAALNMAFFSDACWGVAAHAITAGMAFFAMAALADVRSSARWLRVVLAGLVVGMAVSEGADIGAIFSLYVAAFVIYQAWVATGPNVKSFAVGGSRVAIVAGFAVFLAAHALFGFVTTSIEGIAGTQQDAETKASKWDWATQWSLPESETLSLAVPGLYGYRTDTPNGGQYWGIIGRNIRWERYFKSDGQLAQPTGALLRYTGSGFYTGVPVLLFGVWALLQSFLSKGSIFAPDQRKWIWFWGGAGLISLLLAYGRFAPFYHIVYALPYFSTIRNPVKFLNPLSMALVILFAYGVDGAWRKYMTAAEPKGKRESKARLANFEKYWVYGIGAVFVASVVAWVLYGFSRQTLERYLQGQFFDDTSAYMIAGYSITQVGWFVFWLFLAVLLMTLIVAKVFSGKNAKAGIILLGVLTVADLGTANMPWIIFWDYPDKYASNPVLDILRQKPYEHRVAISMLPPPPSTPIGQIYKLEWLQQQMPYYSIQSLDTEGTPRKSLDTTAFEKVLIPTNSDQISYLVARRWVLTNTRYVLGVADYLNVLNRDVDPLQSRLQIVERFDIVAKPGLDRATRYDQMTAQPSLTGKYALFEFTGALPRAKLYSNWEVNTNEQATLDEVSSRQFDPAQKVLVSGDVPDTGADGTNQNSGTVEITDYHSKYVTLKSDAPGPTVLLFNDRYDPNWKLFVDGKPQPLLHCNFIMQGAALPAGAHTIDFRFEPPIPLFYVSLAGVVLSVLLLGVVTLMGSRENGASTPLPRKGN